MNWQATRVHVSAQTDTHRLGRVGFEVAPVHTAHPRAARVAFESRTGGFTSGAWVSPQVTADSRWTHVKDVCKSRQGGTCERGPLCVFIAWTF